MDIRVGNSGKKVDHSRSQPFTGYHNSTAEVFIESLSQVSKTMGTSVSLVGGGLTIAGGILTIATAGVATPVLIAGTNNN